MIDVNDDSRKGFGSHQEEVTSYEPSAPQLAACCPSNSYQAMS